MKVLLVATVFLSMLFACKQKNASTESSNSKLTQEQIAEIKTPAYQATLKGMVDTFKLLADSGRIKFTDPADYQIILVGDAFKSFLESFPSKEYRLQKWSL